MSGGDDAGAPAAVVTPELLGLALPVECVAGVAANLAVLAEHLRLLDAPGAPDREG